MKAWNAVVLRDFQLIDDYYDLNALPLPGGKKTEWQTASSGVSMQPFNSLFVNRRSGQMRCSVRTVAGIHVASNIHILRTSIWMHSRRQTILCCSINEIIQYGRCLVICCTFEVHDHSWKSVDATVNYKCPPNQLVKTINALGPGTLYFLQLAATVQWSNKAMGSWTRMISLTWCRGMRMPLLLRQPITILSPNAGKVFFITSTSWFKESSEICINRPSMLRS